MKKNKKNIDIDMVPTVLNGDKENATVTDFFPQARFGYAKTSTGEVIHFNMNAARVFIRGTSGPLFSMKYKNTFPNKGDVLCFIRRNGSVAPGKKPSMFVWNFEESYQLCMKDCNEFGPDIEALDELGKSKDEISESIHRRDKGTQQRNPQRKWHKEKYHHSSQEEKNWWYKVTAPVTKKHPTPTINLCSEFRIK